MRASRLAFPAVAVLLYGACRANPNGNGGYCVGGDYLLEGCGIGTVVCTDGVTTPVGPLYGGKCSYTEPAGSVPAKPSTVSCVLTAKCPDGTTDTRSLSWATDDDGCSYIPFAFTGDMTIIVCENSPEVASDASLDVSVPDVGIIDATFDSSSDAFLDASDSGD